MVVQSWREVQNWMAHVGDYADDVAEFYDSPKLPPRFQIVFKKAQIAPSKVIFDFFDKFAKCRFFNFVYFLRVFFAFPIWPFWKIYYFAVNIGDGKFARRFAELDRDVLCSSLRFVEFASTFILKKKLVLFALRRFFFDFWFLVNYRSFSF